MKDVKQKMDLKQFVITDCLRSLPEERLHALQ